MTARDDILAAVRAGLGTRPVDAERVRREAAMLLDDLPDARQDELRPLLRQTFTNMRPQLRAIHDAQAQVEQALTQPELDRAQLQRALTGMQAHMREVDSMGMRGMIELASRLSLAERKQLARKLRAPPWRHGPNHHDGVRGDPPAAPDGN